VAGTEGATGTVQGRSAPCASQAGRRAFPEESGMPRDVVTTTIALRRLRPGPGVAPSEEGLLAGHPVTPWVSIGAPLDLSEDLIAELCPDGLRRS
jgi:hypothetical protein